MREKIILYFVLFSGIVLISLAIQYSRNKNLKDFKVIKAVVDKKGRGGNIPFVHYSYSYKGRSYHDRDGVSFDIINSDDLAVGDTILIRVSIQYPEISEIEDLFPD